MKITIHTKRAVWMFTFEVIFHQLFKYFQPYQFDHVNLNFLKCDTMERQQLTARRRAFFHGNPVRLISSPGLNFSIHCSVHSHNYSIIKMYTLVLSQTQHTHTKFESLRNTYETRVWMILDRLFIDYAWTIGDDMLTASSSRVNLSRNTVETMRS